MTLECLRSVFQETRETDFELIVLDNASSDESASALEKEFSGRIKLIVSPENLGFAAGNNVAAKHATGKYLLLLNPDTVVHNSAIDHLINFAKNNPSAGIWGGRTLFGDGRLNPASCWSRQTFWSLLSQAFGLNSLFRKSSLFNPEAIGGWDRQGLREVDIVSGCFFLIRHNLWKELAGFREMFFMYGEEADLCLRAKKLGCNPMVTSSATIVHYGGASEKIKTDKLVRLLRAKMLLIREHFSPGSKRFGYMLLTLWPASRLYAHFILSKFNRGSSDKYAVWKQVNERIDEWTPD